MEFPFHRRRDASTEQTTIDMYSQQDIKLNYDRQEMFHSQQIVPLRLRTTSYGDLRIRNEFQRSTFKNSDASYEFAQEHRPVPAKPHNKEMQ